MRFTWLKNKISEFDIITKGKTTLNSQLFNKLIPGEYMIIASGKDKNGQPVITKKFFTVFTTSGKKLPGNMISWFAVSKMQAEPGQTIPTAV
jgi:hypothetical protein